MVANADITLYHKTGRDPQTRADLWTATIYNNVHLYCATRATLAAGARNAASAGNTSTPQNVCTVRVFTQQLVPCKIGDVLADGICTQSTPQTARDAGATCYTVSGIFDNRRGSPGMRHWKLEAT